MPRRGKRLAAALLVVLWITWGVGGALAEARPTLRLWLQYGWDLGDTPQSEPGRLTWAAFVHWMLHGWDNPEPMGQVIEPEPTPPLTPTPTPTPMPPSFDEEAFDPNDEIPFEDFDFSDARRFEDKAQLNAYVLHCYDRLYRQIPLRLASPLDRDALDSSLARMDWNVTYAYAVAGTGDLWILVQPEYTPGTRVAQAYRTGEVRELSDRERELLRLAQTFVEDPDFMSARPFEKERRIHDWICQRCDYWTDDDTKTTHYADHQTAIGALLDGKGNCMAYSDAFIMLSRMAGFSTYRVAGVAGGPEEPKLPHAWNVVELAGTWYFVDVTFDDAATLPYPCDYVYFNIDQTSAGATHDWDKDALIWPVASQLDANYAYGNAAFPDLDRVRDADALLELLVRRFADPAREQVMVRCDAFSGELDDLVQRLRSRGATASFEYTLRNLDEALYLCLRIAR